MNKNVLGMIHNNGPFTILSSQPFSQSITINGIYTPKLNGIPIQSSDKKDKKRK